MAQSYPQIQLASAWYNRGMGKYERHIFICTNQREPGSPRGCCDPGGKAELQGLFKQRVKELGLQARVRANKSGCLDQCEHGPTVVVYPEQVWYGRVTKDDVNEIMERHILGGKAVERLVLPEECIHTPVCPHKQPKR
jgi:(2Fe-2S) ferredoxin